MSIINSFDRDDLEDAYIDAILEDAGIVCLNEDNPPQRYQQKYASLEAKFDKYSDKELYNEIEATKPELLEKTYIE
ncbi:hypothetical protein Syn7803C97_64 [Synechococcus phage S-MbCM6]|jgi:hypothetical protein|uniref:Uncharacterized protein n=3 Tax=Namakavirus smbcm6 TaxID=2734120 RepID=H8ZMH1_9CAUD|nr:hypothetical protein [Synechococcus phage ACG-2014c]AHB80700.1 hypothetical protein S-MbCM25_065 [Synechococcus phage S-MbCM25]AFD02682.1 hypothetical protein [Synechococcus phage ACG-2014c]AIX14459.1 hypothetical protein Syn7803C43_64 [Synechococcus phage ACG-2014c]AIX22617.1 hypothetical protein Syn7803C97_64 [Synechococcus phage ACG-2014c]AIX22832.1 hypothetical protein Syn7803C98_64 [Synechococcus phage ACG-2014c]